MELRRPTAAKRQREEQEAAMRRRKMSVRLGTVGIVVLFAAGVGVVVSPANATYLIGVMGIGIAVLIVAFLLVRTPLTDILQVREE